MRFVLSDCLIILFQYLLRDLLLFIEIITLKTLRHEIKKETHCCTADLGSDLSLDHVLSLSVRGTADCFTTLPTYLSAYDNPCALDGICRIALFGCGS